MDSKEKITVLEMYTHTKQEEMISENPIATMDFTSINFDTVKKTFQEQKFLLNRIQLRNRSFSDPELNDVNTVNNFNFFRKFLNAKQNDQRTVQPPENPSPDVCDEPPPKPVPRKGRKKRNIESGSVYSRDDEEFCGSTSTISNDGNFGVCTTNILDGNSNVINEAPLENGFSSSKVPPLEIPTVKTPIKIKNKSSFRAFLKINKIGANKFLSLRNKKSNGRQSLQPIVEPEGYKPRRPTRDPPPPPILVFRPAAPLPEEDSSPECCDGNQGLYDDSANLYELESIYCSVDDEITPNGSDYYSGSVTEFKNHSKDEFFYDDGLCIYEELSSNEGTIYEEYENDEEENIYDNVDLEPEYIEQTKSLEKLRKRFNMTGQEIPVNAGVVKENRKGSKTDLYVRQGETVLILRMENNPPGKWLAKNERSKIGYIDLNNVHLETDSIKAAFQTLTLA